MLERLYVKNIALIEEADIQFDGRLNVLSGETGSGKSVILDSINFVLGSKADKSMIRYGTDEAQVKAEFSVSEDDTVNQVLSEFDIDSDGLIIISRRFTSDGKGSIKINGNTVTAAMLKRVASCLVDVHGQSEHFFLMSENNQLSVVDSLCGEELADLKKQLSLLLHEKRDCQNKIAELGGSEQQRAQKLDLLDYQIREIENADLKVGELDSLKSKQKIIDNAEKVLYALNTIKGILSDDNCCSDMISAACRQAASIADIDRQYEDVYSRLENLSVEAQDISETVSDIADSFTFDEDEARRIDERITLIKNLIKKYGADEEQVLAFLEEAKEQFNTLNDATAQLDKINSKILELDGKIYNLCTKITQIRKDASKKFCSAVEGQLNTLNIPNAKFSVDFEPYTADDYSAGTNGADRICFMFSANKGEPQKPLSKVISGGEMSRFMLAIKTQLKGMNGITTYIFDEIDAGISGVTANSVAEKFIAISKDTQIIAVSHLPQVCAAASAQYLISKTDDNAKTVTNVKRLSSDERVDEIIRLTGSIKSEAAKTHAKELLARFNN